MTRCTHCLKTLKKRTKDHVFPSSWYPANTPSYVQRWTVPSCTECNGKFGKLENNLFPKLALCVDPQKAEASGITKKVLVLFGIGVNNISEKEKLTRETIRKKFLKEVKSYSSKIKPFPGLGFHKDFPKKLQVCISVPPELIPVLEKIIRGVEYKLGKRYIEPPYKLKIYHIFEEPKEIQKVLKYSVITSLGPGFRVERVVSSNQTSPVLYKTTIWGTLISYASIDRIK